MAREFLQAGMPFPVNGVNAQLPRTQQTINTCVNAQNIRVFDSQEDRARGGIRPGLTKYLANTFEGSGRIQDINYTTVVRDADPNTSVLYVRDVVSAAVSNGTIQKFTTNTITAANTTGNATLSNTAPFILSAELTGKLYYTDGLDYKVWDGATNNASDWSPSDGSLPGDPGNTACRLIERWRGRLVLAGLRTDPNNWFMSKLGDPDDFQYAPATITETQAVTGSVGEVGKLGEPITSLIPYSDDVLLFGADASVWQLSGDPQSGGRFDLISDKVGTAFGRPWAKDTEGNVYFFSSRGEVFLLPPGGVKPTSLTNVSIAPLIKDTNLNTHFVRMEWDQDEYGVHIFITPFTTGAATHWFYDMRGGGWWPDVFANTNYNPIAVKLFDGDSPDDRVLLLGGEDGKIRYFDRDVSQDDGNNFISQVTLGPLVGQEVRNNMIVAGVQTMTDVNGAQVKIEVLSGDTPEEALQSEAATFVGEHTMETGLSQTVNPRKRGYYNYIKLGTNAAATSWGLEDVRVSLEQVVTDKARIRATS